MKRPFLIFVIALLMGSVAQAQDENERAYLYPVLKPQENNRRIEPKPLVEGWATQRVEEKINRGLIALRNNRGEMYLSWRLLKDDPSGVAFNIYRSSNNGKSFSKVNGKPLTATTDFIDKGAGNGVYTYQIRPVMGGKEGGPSEKVTPVADGLNYCSIKFQGDYVIQKVALADLNGDGNYDFIIKQPNQATDPGVWRRSPDTFKIEAYLHDGTFLWRKDLGWNIEQGVWYSPFIAWDFDGDGGAEIAVKTAPTNRDYRDPQGRVVGTPSFWYAGEFPQADFTDPCPEFCSILNGMTGEVLDSVPWPPQSQRVGDYVRTNRNQIGVAYLDGKTPALLLNRGTYRAMLLDAYQFKNGKLEKLWSWDGDEENPVIRSQGAHQMLSVDVDGDGRDEIVMGSVTVDDNGTALWSTGFGHPDKAIVGKVSPDREGLQIIYACEVWHMENGVALVDARTGETIWNIGYRTQHVGDAAMVDLDPAYPGLECFGEEATKAGQDDRYMFTADGRRIGSTDITPGCREWIWWNNDMLRATTQRDRASGTFNVIKYQDKSVLASGLQGQIMMIADVSGDWREEIITMLPGELRIYSTTIPARDRRVSLIQDPLYRNYIAHRSMGYDQPPMTSYYMGVDPADASKYTPLIQPVTK